MNQTDKVEVQHYGAGLVVVFTSHEVDGAKCGTCTMCCETTPVVFPDYQKPAHTPCPFQGPEGCLDYEDHPVGCRHYSCMWLRGEISDKYHPQTVGAVFESSMFENATFEGKQELVFVAIHDMKLFSKIDLLGLHADHPNTVWLFFHEDSPALWGKARFVKRAVGLLAGKALPNFPETDDLVLVDLEQREEDDAESESGSL